MKIIKKIAAIMLSVMMVLGMCSVVGAAETSGTSAAKDGKIIIKNAVPEQTYTIYQILELESFSDKTATEPNSGNYAYKATSKWKSFVESSIGKTYLETDDSGYVTWKKNAKPAAFAKEALDYAKKQKPSIAERTESAPPATGESTTSTVIFNNLSLGYYLVDSSVGALCSLDTTAKEVEIQEKNGVPSVEKKVQEDSKIGATDEYGESNTADIGQTVNFQTTITAQPGAQNYVLHDRMSEGLTFDKIDSVKVGDTPLAVNTDYVTESESTGDGCTFHITFTPTYCESIKTETNIVVSYSAILNDKAKIKTDENKNETWLKYGDDKESNKDFTITKTFEIPVFKYTGTDKPLAGAKFTLKKEGSSDAISLISIATPSEKQGDFYRVAVTGEKGNSTVTTGNTGKFTIQGLDAGTYYLTETQQPAGYNKLKDPIKIKIDEAGVIKVVTDKEDEVTEVKVLNKTGSILPSTGGMGTTLFYIFGAILVIGSGVVLITKKRMK